MIDLHLHTTASDGLLSPRALSTRARRSRPDDDRRHRSRHRRRARRGGARPAQRSASASCPGSRSRRSRTSATCTCSGISWIPSSAVAAEFLRDAACRSGPARPGHRARGSRSSGIGIDVEPLRRGAPRAAAAASAGRRSPMRSSRPAIAPTATTRSRGCSAAAGPAFVPRTRQCRPPASSTTIHAAGGIASLAHPGIARRRRADRTAGGRGSRRARGLAQRSFAGAAGALRPARRSSRARAIGRVGLPRRRHSPRHAASGGVRFPPTSSPRLEALAAAAR